MSSGQLANAFPERQRLVRLPLRQPPVPGEAPCAPAWEYAGAPAPPTPHPRPAHAPHQENTRFGICSTFSSSTGPAEPGKSHS